MIIEELHVKRLCMPWMEKPRWNQTYELPRELVVVEIETNSGLLGMGYVMPLFGGAEIIAVCLAEMIRPAIRKRNAADIEGIWHDLYCGTYEIGRMGVAIIALSAVDIALWDLLGKRANLPLFQLWGGAEKSLATYGSGCWRGLGREGMAEKAQSYVEMGFTAIKMQSGHLFTAMQDAENMRFMRETLGSEILIMTDANMAWSADEAIYVGKKLDAWDLYWLEEPVRAEDYAGYFKTAKALSTKVVGGETHFTRFDLRPFFEKPLLPYLQPDVMRGGLTELRKIAALADTWGIRIAPHLFHELMVHVNASIPNPGYLEYLNFLDDLWESPVLPVNGRLTPPDRPGHGLQFKETVLRDFTAKRY